MGVWTLLLNIVGWILVIITIIAAAAFLAGGAIWLVQAIQAARARAKRKREPVAILTDEAILELAEEHCRSKGELDFFGHNPTFMQGVKFALEAKRGDRNADSV